MLFSLLSGAQSVLAGEPSPVIAPSRFNSPAEQSTLAFVQTQVDAILLENADSTFPSISENSQRAAVDLEIAGTGNDLLPAYSAAPIDAIASKKQWLPPHVSEASSEWIAGEELSLFLSDSSAPTPSLTPQPTPDRQEFRPQRVPLRLKKPSQQQPRYVASPGTTSVTPSAAGKSWGSAGVGVGFQGRTRYTETSDGAIAAGMGFGDARTAVGLDVGVAIFNLSDSFGDRGSVSFKLHRQLPNDFAVAVGWQNAIVWGSTDAGNSVYGVVSKMFRLEENVEKPFSRIYLSAGIGSGQYRSEFDINNGDGTIGFFGSAAVRVAEPLNAIAEWSGQDLTLGLSFVPFRNLPLVITPAITDITGNAGDGARFILGIGYGFSFK